MRVLAIVTLLTVGWWTSVIGSEPLTLVRTIELPGVEGRIDHLAFDQARQRLFVAALGNNTVEVLNLSQDSDVRSLAGFHEPQGIAVSPDVQHVAVANGRNGMVDLLDGEALARRVSIPLSNDADNVRYSAATKRFWVGYGSGALTAIDASNGRVISKVPLAGHPESFQLERSGSRVFVNVPSANQIAVVDGAAMKLMTTWPVVGAAANYPMALDETDHRLFIGCRRPARVLVYDTASGKQTAAVDIAGDTDDLFYDAQRRRLYVSAGEGFVDVIQREDPERYTRTAHIPTAAGARTSLFVPSQNRLYLAVPHRGAQKAAIRIYEVRD